METFDQREILRNLNYVCLPVCPAVVITIASERKELRISNFANRPLLAIGRLVLQMGYIGPQDPVPPIVVESVYWDLGHMESPIRTKFNI